MKKSAAVLIAFLILLSSSMIGANAITVERDGTQYFLRSHTPTTGDINVLMVRIGFADYDVDDENDPADSEETLLSYFDGSEDSVNAFYETSSYGKLHQRLDLSGEYFLKQGEKYSVVITMTMQDDDGELLYSRVYSFMGMPQAGVSLNAVVNPGESYAYSDGKWTDWSEIKGGVEDSIYQKAVEEFGSEEEFLKRIPLGKDFVKVDNLPIKAYLVPASAKSGIIRGDADGDGRVTIVDATTVQKFLAEYEMPESFQQESCYVNGDGRITISDVTEIQRYLAGFDNIYHIGEIIFYDEYELSFIPE